VQGLLAGAALPVDSGAWHRLRQPLRAQHRVAADVAGLRTHLAHTPYDEVLNMLAVHTSLFEQAIHHSCAQVCRVVATQAAILLAPSSSDGLDDVRGEWPEFRIGHGCNKARSEKET